jgi:hypothetical protein
MRGRLQTASRWFIPRFAHACPGFNSHSLAKIFVLNLALSMRENGKEHDEANRRFSQLLCESV